MAEILHPYSLYVALYLGVALTGGSMGPRAVLVGVGAVVLLQLAFTYAPPLQVLFATQPLDPLADGLPILAAGLALLLALEAEKGLRRRLAERRG